MACPNFSWEALPLLQLWRGKNDSSGKSTLLQSYDPLEAISLMKEALSNNSISCCGMKVPLPFNHDILKWADETRDILSHAKVPETVKFYNIYGTNNATPHSVCYGKQEAPILNLEDLLLTQPKYICVDGDGTVPTESAKADGLDAVARVGVPADHRGIVCDRHVFRILQHWLNAGEPDPFYNPLNDYVILPTAFEIERYREKSTDVATVVEWDVLSTKDENTSRKTAEIPVMVGSLSISCEDNEHPPEAQATIIVHPQCEGIHVEIRAMGVTMGA